MGRQRPAGRDRLAVPPAPRLGRGGPRVLVVVAALVLGAGAAHAQVRFVDVSGYIGGGAQYGWIDSGTPSINGARGPGVQLVFGRRLRDRYPLYFDLRLGGMFMDVGPTIASAIPSDRADYAIMAAGGLWDFRKARENRSGPWVSLHATYHNLNWRQFFYSIDGFGISPGVGAHVHIPPFGVFRIGVTANFFSAKSFDKVDASGQSLQLSVDYLYEFRSRDGP
jgi:hypothetical protein